MVWFEIIKKQSFNFIIEGLKTILDDEAKRALRLTKPNFSATWRNQKRIKYNEGSFTIDLVIDIDYELVRALKCTEIMKAGFTFRPGSRVEVLCHDIVPIVSLTND